jgi:hypothetical protein
LLKLPGKNRFAAAPLQRFRLAEVLLAVCMTSTVVATVVWCVNQCVVFNGIRKIEPLGGYITEFVFVIITATSQVSWCFISIHTKSFFNVGILFFMPYERSKKSVQSCQMPEKAVRQTIM